MKTKKAKALALELMDDLLGTETSKRVPVSSDEQFKGKTPTGAEASVNDASGSVVPPTSNQSTDAVEIDIDAPNPYLIASEDETVEPSRVTETGASERTMVSDPILKNRVSAHNEGRDVSDKTNVEEEDATIKLSESKIVSHPSLGAPTQKPANKHEEEEAVVPTSTRTGRTGLHKIAGLGGVSSPAQVSLVQSENLKIAQQRILELEDEISRLRTENEALAAAGETLKTVTDKSKSELDLLHRKLREKTQNSKQEISHLEEVIKQKNAKVSELEQSVSQMDMRLSTSIQKIRVRERELENRLELVKLEGQAVLRSKDELILDLKRQIDQLGIELENYRAKSQDLNKHIDEKQEVLNRTVKALRLALSLLEGKSGSSSQSGKKVS